MGTLAQMSLQPGWVRALMEPQAYPHTVGHIQLIETHISWVFLTGDYVYKVKKPVDLGFVDFSSLARRKFFCEEEIRLNQRTSEEFYLGVVPIGVVDGVPEIGREPAVEYAVRMRQFPSSARLDRRLAAGKVSREDMRKAGEQMAAFHAALPPIIASSPQQAGEQAGKPALNNFLHIKGDHISRESRRQIDIIETWTVEQSRLLLPVFKQRAQDGYVRECHGDLHLANLFQHDDRIYPFDSLEFNAELRCIDPVSDIAFLVMDLMARRRTDLAYVFLNSWLEASGDYQGLAVLRFYLVYRCMVRLKVASIQTQQLHEDAQGEHAIKARQYLELARVLMHAPQQPLLVLMHGLSASGKTRTSGEMMLALPAIRVRSDLERKRLHGVPRHEHQKGQVESGLYSNASTERTYMAVEACCAAGLKADFNMIADATFAKREWRKRFLDMALRVGARAAIMECSAPIETLQARIKKRASTGRDESDADLAVLAHQVDHFDALDAEERHIAVRDFRDLMR